MKRLYVTLLMGGAAVALGTAALAMGAGKSRATAPPAAELSIPQRHTLADLEALPSGITYDDAARMLGTPGHAEPRSAAGLPGVMQDATAAVYAWPNADGSRIILVFRGDRLTQKTHIGLR